MTNTDHLDTLLEDQSSLVDFFHNYQEKVRRERQSHAVQRAELNECKRSEAALRKSEARYRSLVNATAQAVWTTNAEGHVVDDLPSWQSLSGQSREVMQGWGWLNAIHPDDRAETARQWTQAVATKGIYEIEHRVRLVDGSYRFFLARGVPVLDLEGKILEWVGTHTDITAHKQAQEALHQSQTRFQRLVANMPGMVYRYLPCADGPDQFTFVNSASGELLELEPEMVLQDASSFLELIHPDDLLSFQESVLTSTQSFLPWRWEGRIITPSGQFKWIQGSSRPERTAEGDVWDGLLLDITSRKQAEEQLVRNAFYDALTGLANRTLFMERLEQAVEQAKRHKDYLFAVLFLDLDRFKVINDSLGHLLGDQLLSDIANRLTACLRPTDTLARLGGDEFTLLIENIRDVSDALRVAKRIQAELSIPFELDGQNVFTSASIGIALSARGYKQPEDILRDADIAMYRAKSQGAARYEIFNTQMYAQAVARLQLETELRLAVERQEFRIYYQPIVELATSFLVGFEALVRWQHPTRGLIFPIDFLPVALETGLSSLIDQWVLAQACCQTQQWQEQHPHFQPLTISVNVCSSRLAQPELIEQTKQILLQTGLDASSLKLEITEDAIMENNEAVTSKFAQLQAIGIQLSIDDFGTGYSSLSRLDQFPISMLKIDRSFISKLGQNSKDIGIVEAIVTLAQKLGIEVIAEGVETLEQLQKLRELKCQYGQGYLFSRPLDSDAAEALIVGCVAKTQQAGANKPN